MNTVYQYSDAHTLLFVCMYVHMYVIRLIYNIYIYDCVHTVHTYSYIYIYNYGFIPMWILMKPPVATSLSKQIQDPWFQGHDCAARESIDWQITSMGSWWIWFYFGSAQSRSDQAQGNSHPDPTAEPDADMCSPCNHTSWRGAANCLLIASPENTEVKWRKKWKVSC